MASKRHLAQVRSCLALEKSALPPATSLDGVGGSSANDGEEILPLRPLEFTHRVLRDSFTPVLPA